MNKGLTDTLSVKKDIIGGIVQQLLDQGTIQPSCSPFTSPAVLVGKKYWIWRLCVDYTDLNKHTVKNKFLIPIVEDLLDELGGSKIFSEIDLRSGYHQLRMATNDVPKTAFWTQSGHFEYLVMPFGLSNAPATFQGLMNFVFQKFLKKEVLVFFDDILIYNSNMEDHLNHLRVVFEEMQLHQLFAKKSKCFFGVKRIGYLGHSITAKGVSTDPQKVEAVKNWCTPTTLKQQRGFLGLAGYYRRFIQGFGVICKPLPDLTKTDSFKWSTTVDSTFAKLKKASTQALVLALPNVHKTFVVETDESGYGIGAVLMQGHLIAFISKALSPRHATLIASDRELDCTSSN